MKLMVKMWNTNHIYMFLILPPATARVFAVSAKSLNHQVKETDSRYFKSLLFKSCKFFIKMPVLSFKLFPISKHLSWCSFRDFFVLLVDDGVFKIPSEWPNGYINGNWMGIECSHHHQIRRRQSSPSTCCPKKKL